MKLAVIEGEWHTEPAPAPFTLFGLPDTASPRNERASQGALDARADRHTLGGYRSSRNLSSSCSAPSSASSTASRPPRRCALLRQDPNDPAARQTLKAHAEDLGYALLLRKYVEDPAQATAAQIDQAAWDTVPSVAPMFWSFRVMVGLGFFFIALFAVGFYLAAQRRIAQSRVFLKIAAVDAAAALDRGRVGLVRRRAWPAALGDRGRAADVSRGLADPGVERRAESRGIRDLLYRARGHRRVSAQEIREARTRRGLAAPRHHGRRRGRSPFPPVYGARSHHVRLRNIESHLVAAARQFS